jgi:hypothetical protein
MPVRYPDGSEPPSDRVRRPLGAPPPVSDEATAAVMALAPGERREDLDALEGVMDAAVVAASRRLAGDEPLAAQKRAGRRRQAVRVPDPG